MHNPQSSWHESNGLKLHYVEWCNPGAPHLLLVHGQMDHCRNWDWVAQSLRHQFHIIAVDLRGHGDSEWAGANSYSVIEHVYDLRQLINRLGLEALTIIGHSLGGAISLKYAGIYPEKMKRVVAIEGAGPSPDVLKQQQTIGADQRFRDWAETLNRLAEKKERSYATQEEAVTRMQQANRHLSVERARHLAIHGSRRGEDGRYRWKFDPKLRAYHPFDMTAQDTRQLWRKIDCPVMLIRGEDSWACNPAADGRADYFSKVRVLNVPGAAHWVHHDQFDIFMAAVNDFLGLQPDPTSNK